MRPENKEKSFLRPRCKIAVKNSDFVDSEFVKTCDELVIGPQCPAWVNNPYALKNHQLLYHNEHYQCSFCKNAWPLNQAEDFKLHMFRQEVIKRGVLDIYLLL